MRKLVIVILGLSLVTFMTYGITGVGATFTSALDAGAQVEVGTMQIMLDGNPQDVRCADVNIVTPDSTLPVVCDVVIGTNGSIPPDRLSVLLDVGGSFPDEEMAKFSIAYSMPGSDVMPSYKLTDKNEQDLFTAGPVALPYTLHTLLSWQGLGTASMAQTMNLKLTITETQHGY